MSLDDHKIEKIPYENLLNKNLEDNFEINTALENCNLYSEKLLPNRKRNMSIELGGFKSGEKNKDLMKNKLSSQLVEQLHKSLNEMLCAIKSVQGAIKPLNFKNLINMDEKKYSENYDIYDLKVRFYIICAQIQKINFLIEEYNNKMLKKYFEYKKSLKDPNVEEDILKAPFFIFACCLEEISKYFNDARNIIKKVVFEILKVIALNRNSWSDLIYDVSDSCRGGIDRIEDRENIFFKEEELKNIYNAPEGKINIKIMQHFEEIIENYYKGLIKYYKIKSSIKEPLKNAVFAKKNEEIDKLYGLFKFLTEQIVAYSTSFNRYASTGSLGKTMSDKISTTSEICHGLSQKTLALKSKMEEIEKEEAEEEEKEEKEEEEEDEGEDEEGEEEDDEKGRKKEEEDEEEETEIIKNKKEEEEKENEEGEEEDEAKKKMMKKEEKKKKKKNQKQT